MKRELKIFDKPENVKRLLVFFFVFLAGLVAIDLVLWVLHRKHAELPWEGAPAFFAAYGFCSYVLLIFVAKGLRLFVKRDENYYD
jgi:hypothetical protein